MTKAVRSSDAKCARTFGCMRLSYKSVDGQKSISMYTRCVVLTARMAILRNTLIGYSDMVELGSASNCTDNELGSHPNRCNFLVNAGKVSSGSVEYTATLNGRCIPHRSQ